MQKKYGLSITEPCEEVFSCGLFSSVEYATTRLDKDTFDIIKEDAQKLKGYSEKYNTKIKSFHLPFSHNSYYKIAPSSLDEAVREKSLEYTKKLIDIYSLCNIEYIVIHASARVEDKDRPKHLKAFTDYLKKLCDYCLKYNIKVAVESLKPRCIGNGKDELLYIMENVKRENAGICFDSNHLLNEDNIEFLKECGKYVIATHLSDFDGIDERHWYPGRGINKWKEIVSLLKENGYSGDYTFEVSWPDDKPCLTEYKKLIDEWESLF